MLHRTCQVDIDNRYRLRRAGTLKALGLLTGGLGAWYLSAGLESFLFEVQPNDLGIFAAALAVLACAGLLASALPVRRAATRRSIP